MVEPWIQEEQCGLCPGPTLYLVRLLEGAWEVGQPVHMCFVDQEKPYDCVSQDVLWGVFREYGLDGLLLRGYAISVSLEPEFGSQ